MNGKCKPKKEGCKAPVHVASRIRGVEYSITEYFVVLCFFFFGSEEADLETVMFLVLLILVVVFSTRIYLSSAISYNIRTEGVVFMFLNERILDRGRR